ncbi:MAG: Dyp-type peroxidase [Kofleriaceae bacterium]
MARARPVATPEGVAHPEPADLEDIQGLVYRSWADHPYAAYLFASFGDARRARGWLTALHPRISPVSRRDGAGPLQVALTPAGLAALGVPAEVVAQLPYEALAGMRARARILGDPLPVEWTLCGDQEPHVLVMVYAKTTAARAALVEEQRAALAAAGARVEPAELSWPLGDREHFGFVDGISQPFIRGLHEQPRPGRDLIAAGELLLGYPNEYGRTPRSPHWGELDFGRNGSYLVFRKLEQHVEQFWGYLHRRAEELCADEPEAKTATAELLAAKLVGRWRSGASLVGAPHGDPGATAPSLNAFGYLDEDPHGLQCPISSHVRRANPRDAHGGSAANSLAVIARHRILRRGRPFGPPLPEQVARTGVGDRQPRGLYFLCLQTSIARGFEFIQQSWLNNRGFGGLFQEADPIAGAGGCPFTIPEDPVRLRLPAVPRLVTMRGGGYFFLPSLTALARIARGPDA